MNFSLVLRTFFVLFLSCSHCYEGAWKSLQGRGKSHKVGFSPYLQDFSRHLHSSEKSSKKVRKRFVGQGINYLLYEGESKCGGIKLPKCTKCFTLGTSGFNLKPELSEAKRGL